MSRRSSDDRDMRLVGQEKERGLGGRVQRIQPGLKAARLSAFPRRIMDNPQPVIRRGQIVHRRGDRLRIRSP